MVGAYLQESAAPTVNTPSRLQSQARVATANNQNQISRILISHFTLSRPQLTHIHRRHHHLLRPTLLRRP